jgi:DNA-binding SARP family transcriptional activator/tetratricopeptide (TPR) repeat protein
VRLCLRPPGPVQCGAVTASASPTEPRLILLAAPHLRAGGQRRPLPQSAPGLLLACLAVHGAPMPRERVAVLFWPDADEAQAQHHLRVTLHRSRQWLAGQGAADRLQADRQRLHLALDHDVAAFRAAIAQADWAAATALHQAPLLDGLAAGPLLELDGWFAAERESLRAQWRDAARREADRLAGSGDATAACAVLRRLLADEVLAEDVLQALLRVAAVAGERSVALDLHERFCSQLRTELGLQPMAETTLLAAALRQRLVVPAAPPPGPAALTPMAINQPPLAGRQAERLLVANPGARLLVVAGEPGVGKTRLVGDAAGPALWWRCRPGLQSVPLLPVAEALQQQLGRLRDIVSDAASLRELARLVPALAPGEALPPVDASSPRLLLTLAEVLPRLAASVVIDDLQWVDSGTLQLLRLLLATTPLQLRATLRDNEAPPAVARWLAETRAAGLLRELKLAPLPAAATAQLLESLAGQAAPRLAAWLQQATGGNPFFALETLRALFESGQLRATDSGWARPLDDIGEDFRAPQVPPRVAAVLQQRLGDLPEPTQRVLLAAAVVGDAAHEALLAQVGGLSAWATAEALAQAQQAGLLVGSGFAHDLAREALLARTAPALLRVLHAGVVRHGAALLGPHRLAVHAWAAGLEDAAVDATLAAAVHDRELGLLEQAQALLAAAQQRTADSARLARLTLERAECAETAGHAAQAEAFVQAVLDTSDDPKLRARALGTRVVLLYQQGRLAEARRLADETEALDPGWPDRDTVGAKLAYAAGDFTRAITHMQRHVAMLRTRGASADLASALSGLATAIAGQGRLEEALPLHREAMAMARRFKARFFEVYATSNYLWAAARLPAGHAEAALLGRAALGLGEYIMSSHLRVNLGGVLQRLGANAEAAALYEQQARHGADPSVAAICWARLVDVRVQLGEHAGLGEAIEQALALLARTESPVAQATVVIAALEHGNAQQVQRALAARRAWPLAAALQQRLQAALRRHGMADAG